MALDLSHQIILVADDEAFSRTMIARMLQRMGANVIHQTANGEEAMQFLWSAPRLSFVISDLNMPVVNGLQVLKSVRTGQSGVHRATPFAMLTAYSDKHLVDIALKLDVNSFVVKPVSKDALEKRLTHLLRHANDTSWLKSAEAYHYVEARIGAEPRPSNPTREAEREREAAAQRLTAEIVQSGRSATKKPRGEKFSESDLAASESEDRRFKESDLRSASGNPSVVRRLTSLHGRFKDSDLAGDVAAGISRLVAEMGDESAADVVGVLDELEQRGTVSLGDIAGALTVPPPGQGSQASVADDGSLSAEEELRALGNVPVGARLARDIKTRDGEVFIKAGIKMTPLTISLLSHLDSLKVLSLDDGGIYVRVPSESALIQLPGKAREVSLDEVQEGARLARGVYTVDGNLYLPAGASLTARTIALLQDLRDLDKLAQPIWIGT